MVMPALKEKYHVWDLKNLPWDLNDFNWHKVVKKDNKTGKPAAYAVNLLKNIKKASQQARAIVIATDTDETTGEGELLAWEIILVGAARFIVNIMMMKVQKLFAALWQICMMLVIHKKMAGLLKELLDSDGTLDPCP